MALSQSIKQKHTSLIKTKALELGFDSCGISKAEFLEDEAKRYESWLKQNKNGQMYYLENNFDCRLDPRLLLEGAKSVISLLINYYPEKKQGEKCSYKISKYAYGVDYHVVIKEKLKTLIEYISSTIGEISVRPFVDSGQVMEKAWAAKSGLGWIGKNSLLITKKGSFYFIGDLITDLDLEYDTPLKTDICGSCTKCIEACPTKAIDKAYSLDATKCISYLTIELKDKIPQEFKGKWENWIYGCDICQDVCPWNKFAVPNNEPQFNPVPNIMNKSTKDWEQLDEEKFRELFRNSAVIRSKYKGLMRNIKFLT